jgi:hypothetical protein
MVVASPTLSWRQLLFAINKAQTLLLVGMSEIDGEIQRRDILR